MSECEFKPLCEKAWEGYPCPNPEEDIEKCIERKLCILVWNEAIKRALEMCEEYPYEDPDVEAVQHAISTLLMEER